MDEAYDAFQKMLIWRKEKDVQKYFEKVKEVDFDVHKVPYAEVFERFVFFILFNRLVVSIQIILTKLIRKVI